MKYALTVHQHTTIQLATGSTYTLTQPFTTAPAFNNTGLPSIVSSLTNITIEGNGATIERSSEPGTLDFRFFSIGNGRLTLRNLTLANGSAREGGAIAIGKDANLTLENMTFRNNRAAIDSFSAGGALNSDLSNNTIVITGSRFEGNVSYEGGAIALAMPADVTITDSVFTRNEASSGNGSSIHFTRSGNVVVTNNCFVYNSGTSFHNDIVNNGGKIINAANNWWGASNGPSGAGSGGGDAISVQVTYEPFITTKPAHCPSSLVIATNQSLSMLDYHGSLNVTLNATEGIPGYTFVVTSGPAHGTLTGTPPNLVYTPDPGYSGVDQFTFEVTDTVGATDTGTVGILIESTAIVVNSTAQEVPFVTNGNCTLGEAIQAANTDAPVDGCSAGNGDDIINLLTGTYTLSQPDNTLDGPNGLPSITSNIAITGSGALIERSSAPDTPDFRLFHVSQNGSLELDELTLRNGRLKRQNSDTVHGGGIFSLGTLTLRDVTISDNEVSYNGAIYINSASQSFVMVNGTLENNLAGVGGGLWVCASASISDSLLANNEGTYSGGIHNLCGTTTITGTTIQGNRAFYYGGGIGTRGGSEKYIITDTIFADNTAPIGSSIANNTGASASTVTISNSCILDQSASAVHDANFGGSVTAINNWWGSSSGPSGTGLGHGSSISGQSVTFVPYLMQPVLGCIVFPVTALNQAIPVAYETDTLVTLMGIDGEPPYTFEITRQPSHGLLNGTLPVLTYTPDNGFAGQDHFYFEVTDADGTVDEGMITLLVTSPVTAQNLALTTGYETQVNFNLSANGSATPYTFALITQPASGIISGTAPNLSYLPDTGFTGSDQFTFLVTDANGLTGTGTVVITVGPPLSVNNQNLTTFQNTSLPITFSAAGGTPPYTFAVNTPPANGILYLNGQQRTYVPRTGYSGFDSLIYRATDAKGVTALGMINIAVNTIGTNQPSNLAVVNDARPTFVWQPFGGADMYRLQVDNNPDFTSPDVDVTAELTRYTIPMTQPELDQGEYYWRVAAVSETQEVWSSAPQFTVFLGTSPSNNSYSQDGKVLFKWKPVDGAAGYRLQVDDDTDFSADLLLDLNLGNVTSHRLTDALPYGNYYWRVLRMDETPADGVLWSFTVTPSTLASARITAPGQSALLGENVVSVEWEAVPGAASYEIQIDEACAFNTAPAYHWEGVVTEQTTSALPDGQYYLRLRTINEYGARGKWSAIRAFRVDTTAPDAPVLSTPADTQVLTTRIPTFSWRSSRGATSYVLEIATDADFEDIILSYTVTTTKFKLPGSVALPDDTYYWRVRAQDKAGNLSAFSLTRMLISAF